MFINEISNNEKIRKKNIKIFLYADYVIIICRINDVGQ